MKCIFFYLASFLTSLSHASSIPLSHLQLHAHWDKQNVITIKENVTANQWQPLASRWRALSILHSHTDQRGMLSHWWMTHCHFKIALSQNNKDLLFPEARAVSQGFLRVPPDDKLRFWRRDMRSENRQKLVKVKNDLKRSICDNVRAVEDKSILSHMQT